MAVTNKSLRGNSTPYKVVVNHEEQYSIWPAHLTLQKGWKDAGKEGTLEQCTRYIRKVWTDMRPLSMREQVDGKTRKMPAVKG